MGFKVGLFGLISIVVFTVIATNLYTYSNHPRNQGTVIDDNQEDGTSIRAGAIGICMERQFQDTPSKSIAENALFCSCRSYTAEYEEIIWFPKPVADKDCRLKTVAVLNEFKSFQ